ncbi:hypothetical protein [Rhizomonospora bruguierae]|uniref:hypothetical protein n=1 Tax=Rhizomonospora bruguierae TaxID=1581705 RepID=UPI001BCF106A|nr:hypothetical protein [Micromonospora sp. NBRC 107566]
MTPLASPELIRFGEWLPQHWRRRKLLLRQRLERMGMPAEVVNPPVRENLAGLMGLGLRRHGLPLLARLLRDGLLVADLGYVDPQKLRQACHDAELLPTDDLDRRLYPVVAVERALRSVAGRPVAVSRRRPPASRHQGALLPAPS